MNIAVNILAFVVMALVGTACVWGWVYLITRAVLTAIEDHRRKV